MNSIEEIELLQEAIFECNFGRLDSKILLLLDHLQQHPKVKENGMMIQSCLKELLGAYQNKDYLLLADILEFTLKPLVGSEM